MRPAEAILCADIGTSSIKLSLINFNGKQLSFVRESFPFARVTAGTVEAADWKEGFKQGTGSLKKKSPGVEIKAISISGNGPTLVPVTHEGVSLMPLHWYDRRVYTPQDLSGIQKSFFLPHAAWLRHNAEDQYEKVKFFLSTQEWLSYQLGAEPVTVLPSGSYGPYYWDEDQCRAFGLDFSKFAPFTEMGAGIGIVSSEAAGYFDLPPGIPIVAGGPDFVMALIGTGTIRNGIVCDRAGTSEGINVCTDSPVFAPELRTLPHVKEGLWNVGAMLPTSGRLFEWFRDITGQQDRPYQEMMEEIVTDQGFDCQPSESDFFPGLKSGMLTSPSCLVSTAGLTTRAQLGRAMVESIGFMVLDALQTLRSRGFMVEEMRLSGGQAKNPLWNQLKANISGCTLLVPEIIDAELAGNACTALMHLREASSLDEACQRIVIIKDTYLSDPGCHETYVRQFESYKTLKSRMENLFT